MFVTIYWKLKRLRLTFHKQINGLLTRYQKYVPILCLKCEADLIVKLGPVLEHLLGALNVQEDVGKGPDGILVAPHHHVSKAHIVERCDLTRGYARVQVLKVEHPECNQN